MKKVLLLFAAVISIYSYSQKYVGEKFYLDTIDFEEPYQYIEIDTSTQNLWQIGIPNKVIFNSAYSPVNVLLTDTVNTYPINNYSYFDLYVGEWNFGTNYPMNIWVEFKHKFNTDTLKDGGYITVSFDNGQTFFNIIDDTIFYNYCYSIGENFNCYSENDTLFNGEKGFSGNSDAWQTNYFTMHIEPVKNMYDFTGDTMIFRFNFISDSIETNKEGWMIDDIKLYWVDLGNEVNVLGPNEFDIYPNPCSGIFTVRGENINKIEITDSNGKIILKQNDIIEFNNFDLTKEAKGIYFVKITNSNSISTQKIVIK